jgi:hypothetical protein
MKRLWTLAVLLAVSASARAHFVWIVPPLKQGQPARVVFSDSLLPDKPELLKKIAQTEFFVRGADGKTVPIKATTGEDALDLTLPPGDGVRLVGGVCRYGVVQRGQSEPFLLHYFPKSVVGNAANVRPPRGLLTDPWDKLPLQVVAGPGSAVRVLWRGEPLAGAEVSAHLPGREKPLEGKTGSDGTFNLAMPVAVDRGIVAIRASHVEETAGELDGKKYKSAKHYATFTINLHSNLQEIADPVETPAVAAKNSPPQEDPGATKLLADARAARANWENFPGFSADVEVNFDGKVAAGTVSVDPKGKVTLQMNDPAASAWAKRMLGSIVGHRLAGGDEEKTPCAFADEAADHPLGRAIKVLNDEFHSSYRVRDKQVIEVNRVMKDARFTITVLENNLNAEKQYLPATYVVNYWDLKTNALQRAEAHYQSWQRIGRFDLPLGALVVTSLPSKQETKSLKLSKVRLEVASR